MANQKRRRGTKSSAAGRKSAWVRRKRPLILDPRLNVLFIIVAFVSLFTLTPKVYRAASRPFAVEAAQQAQIDILTGQYRQLSSDVTGLDKRAAYLSRKDGVEATSRYYGFLRPGEESVVIDGGVIARTMPVDHSFGARVRRAWNLLMQHQPVPGSL